MNLSQLHICSAIQTSCFNLLVLST